MLKKSLGYAIFCFLIFSVGFFIHTPQEERDRLIEEQKIDISGFPKCAGSPISFTFSSDVPTIPDEIKLQIEKWDNCVGSYDFEFSGRYSGGWKSGKEHFYGAWSNGEDVYIGGFSDGLWQGYGHQYSFGEIVGQGYYEAGKLKNAWWF